MFRTALVTALAPALWGTTYVVTTDFLPPDRPLLVAALRVMPVGILLVLWSRQLPSGCWWWRTAVLGSLNIAIFQTLLFVAAYRLPGGVAATAGAIQPLVVAAFAALLLDERFRTLTAAASVAGTVGVGLLVLTPQSAMDPIGVAAALAGTVSMAAGVVLTKHWGRPVGLLAATGWQLVAGGLLLAPASLIVEGAPPAFTGRNWAGAAWLALVGTGFAYSLWFWGIERLTAARASFLVLLSPLVATALGWIALDQALTAGQVAGAALIAGALLVAQLGQGDPGTRGQVSPRGAYSTGHDTIAADGADRRRRRLAGPACRRLGDGTHALRRIAGRRRDPRGLGGPGVGELLPGRGSGHLRSP
jgi:probable blue pigment (indigoidine) exporter